jgi:hypothetical protein
MRRKTKTLSTPLPLRKAAMSASIASRRSFPAWIDAGERVVTLSAAIAVPRIRDALILRTVARPRPATPNLPPDADGAR